MLNHTVVLICEFRDSYCLKEQTKQRTFTTLRPIYRFIYSLDCKIKQMYLLINISNSSRLRIFTDNFVPLIIGSAFFILNQSLAINLQANEFFGIFAGASISQKMYRSLHKRRSTKTSECSFPH